VVNTGNWWPGKRVLLSPTWVAEIEWASEKVKVPLSQAVIKNSPAFDPNAPINREYEQVLYDYYGRPHYWAETREHVETR